MEKLYEGQCQGHYSVTLMKVILVILYIPGLTPAAANIDTVRNFGDYHLGEISSPIGNNNVSRSSLTTDRDKDSEKSPYVDPEVSLLRDKRSLTFPDPSQLLLIFGLGTPLQLDRESVIVGAFTKMLYTMPSNSTDFTEPGVYFARRKSRWSIYKMLERAAELYGFGDGKGCLLRAVCEVAAAPFDLHHGLFGQMAQAFLTPSSTSEAYDEYGDREYHAAERLGRNVNENCHALYPECERSVLDVFSSTTTTTTTAAKG